MLKKSRIFYFFSSLIITVFVGYFAWSAIASVGGDFVNKILSYTDKISAGFFSASVLSEDSQIGEIIPSASFVSDNKSDGSPAEEEIQNPPIVAKESRQDLLDDIQEKLDIIQQQVNELVALRGQNDQEGKLEEDLKEEDLEEKEKTEEIIACTGQIDINTASEENLDKIIDVGLVTAQKIVETRPFYSLNDLLKVSGIGEKTLQKIIEQGCAYVDPGLVPPSVATVSGGSAPVVYPKILISEVQIAGEVDEKQEFVELYNPNDQDVDLTGWYLQKETGSGTVSYFDKKSLFSGQKILANGYFLIAREGYFGSLANISVDDALSDNSSLFFKNPNDNISDQVTWSEIAGGFSFGRKWDSASSTEQNFELQISTPKSQNITYIATPPSSGGGGSNVCLATPGKNILISEVQIDSVMGAGGTNDDWVELYNPNDTCVSLAGWSLQKHSSDIVHESCSLDISFGKINFSDGATIPAKGYFLIARNDAAQDLLDLADTKSSYLQLSDNNTIYLVKSQNKIIGGDDSNIIDKVGFGLACHPENFPVTNPLEGQSIGRKVLDDGTEQDTDNNSADFEIGTPTPKSQNIKWVEPPAPTLASIEITTMPTKLDYFVGDELDISGLLVTGIYSDGSTALETIVSADIMGFDSLTPIEGQTLTITVGGQIATYTININEAVDISPPTGIIIINDGAEYTNSRDVILSLFAEDDMSEVIEMKIANSSSYHDWEPYAESKEWLLPATNGIKTVRVKFKDSAGNGTDIGIPDTIILDTVVPVIALNGEAEIVLSVGDEYQELGATIEDENISDEALVIGGDIVDTSIAGNFYVTYDAEDLAGNDAVQIVRTMIVNNIED